MSNPQMEEYTQARKKTLMIYGAVGITLAAILVLFVARDYEEMFFYGLMTPAAFYVFRPTERALKKWVFKLFKVSPPEA